MRVSVDLYLSTGVCFSIAQCFLNVIHAKMWGQQQELLLLSLDPSYLDQFCFSGLQGASVNESRLCG